MSDTKVKGNILKTNISVSGNSDIKKLSLHGDIKTDASLYPKYSGIVEVTPSQDEVILATAGTIVRDNIKVNPIPSNYGLITYNGAYITVS